MNELVLKVAETVAGIFPFECLEPAFMQTALLALLLIAPLTALSGIQVVNSRMAFFTDAIGHSAFAGVAAGMILGVGISLSMPLTALLVGLLILFLKQTGKLSSDTVTGVIFSAVAALGLAIVARNRAATGSIRMFLFGDILTIEPRDILQFAALLAAFLIFQFFAFNRLLLIGVNPMLAAVHKIHVNLYQYLFSALLSLVVISSVRACGVVLVTALLVIPAAAARNFSSNIRTMFFWALAVSLISSVGGLILSAQTWADVPAGSAVVLCSAVFFFISMIYSTLRPSRNTGSAI